MCSAIFTADNTIEKELRQHITWMWEETNWNWHRRDNTDLLYWHWSPKYTWDMNFELRGWNETLITYILAASAPRYPINGSVYHKCLAESSHL